MRLRAYFGPHITPAHLKLAEVPDGGDPNPQILAS